MKKEEIDRRIAEIWWFITHRCYLEVCLCILFSSLSENSLWKILHNKGSITVVWNADNARKAHLSGTPELHKDIDFLNQVSPTFVGTEFLPQIQMQHHFKEECMSWSGKRLIFVTDWDGVSSTITTTIRYSCHQNTLCTACVFRAVDSWCLLSIHKLFWTTHIIASS